MKLFLILLGVVMLLPVTSVKVRASEGAPIPFCQPGHCPPGGPPSDAINIVPEVLR